MPAVGLKTLEQNVPERVSHRSQVSGAGRTSTSTVSVGDNLPAYLTMYLTAASAASPCRGMSLHVAHDVKLRLTWRVSQFGHRRVPPPPIRHAPLQPVRTAGIMPYKPGASGVAIGHCFGFPSFSGFW